MPDRLTESRLSPVFVGRAAELGALDEARSSTLGGAPAVVLVGGEAGVGKTRLVEEAALRSARAGDLVLSGACVELGEDGVPFAPVVGALRDLVRQEGADALVARAGAGAADLGRLLPELASGPLGAGPRGRVFEAVADLLERLGRERPVLLVVEDLHWADRSTRELLDFTARSLRDSAVLVVATYRSDSLHRGHPLRAWLAELDRLRGVRHLNLGRFGRAEVEQQLAGILGTAPGPAQLEDVWQRSEGNAFFVEELSCCSDGLPATLRDLLLTRVETLPERTQQVLRLACAAGRQVEHSLLAEVATMPEDDLLAALREAVSRHVLVAGADGGLRFRHSLLREALYDDLLPGERTRVHARYADALAARPELAPPGRASAEEAVHRYAAHDHAGALAVTLDASGELGKLTAFAEQRALLERALEVWPVVPEAREVVGVDHLGLLEMAAEAAGRAGDDDRASALLDAALAEVDRTSDPARAARLLAARGRLACSLWSGAGEDLRAALDLLPDEVSELRASLLAQLAVQDMVTPRPEQGLALAEQAARMARAAAAPVLAAHADITAGSCRALLGDVDAGLAQMQGALAVAGELGDDDLAVRALANLSDALAGAGDYERASALALRGTVITGRQGVARTNGAFLVGNAVEPLLRLGRWEQAARLLEDALALDPPGVNALFLHALSAELASGRGHRAEASRHLAGARSLLGRRLVSAQYRLPLHRIGILLALADGQPDEAAGSAADALATLRDGPYALEGAALAATASYAWPLLGACARAARELAQRRRDLGATADDPVPGRPDQLAAATSALAAQLPTVGRVHAAWARQVQAELAEATGSSSPRLWSGAAERWRGLGELPALAYALSRCAAAHVLAGERVPARDAAAEAAALAARLGARPLREDVEVLARAAGLRLDEPSQDAQQGPGAVPATRRPLAGLTPREHEVLRLVAEGRSNKQIGQILVISTKTASVHVSNIIAKLGVSGRGEAAALAHRLAVFEDQPA